MFIYKFQLIPQYLFSKYPTLVCLHDEVNLILFFYFYKFGITFLTMYIKKVLLLIKSVKINKQYIKV